MMTIDNKIEQALTFYNANQIRKAEKVIQQMLAINADDKDARLLWGYILLRNKESRKALETLVPLVADFLEDSNIYHKIGLAWHNLGDLDKACGAYQRALTYAPDFLEALYDLGCALLEQGEYALAVAQFEKVPALEENLYAGTNLAKAYYSLGEIGKAVRLFEKYDAKESRINLATIIPGLPAALNQDVLAARKNIAGLLFDSETDDSTTPVQSNRSAARDSEGKIKVGYISSFFHRTNWMKPVWALLNRHDREKFQVFLFSDASRQAVIASGEGYQPFETDVFFNCEHLSNQAVAELIRKNRLDLLIDLNGYSDLRRLSLFSGQFSLACRTIAWFNMYATSGLPGYDYLIGDNHVITVDEEVYYSEKVVKLPMSYLTFNVNYHVPDVSAPPSLKNNYITFGSLASQYKITPETIRDWCAILSGSPEARLLLRNKGLTSEHNQAYIRRQFSDHNIDSDRITLLGKAPHFEFLKTYDQIDIALDSYPYNGGTTTTESIWQGVPVITFDGDRWVSRTSKTILSNTHLKDFVRSDCNDYIGFAVKLANDPETPEYLKDLRQNMRINLTRSSVCDADRFVQHMEALYIRLRFESFN